MASACTGQVHGRKTGCEEIPSFLVMWARRTLVARPFRVLFLLDTLVQNSGGTTGYWLGKILFLLS
jgi:hypothetical protein